MKNLTLEQAKTKLYFLELCLNKLTELNIDNKNTIKENIKFYKSFILTQTNTRVKKLKYLFLTCVILFTSLLFIFNYIIL